MPNRSATRASGFINPADGLSFSGAVVAQNKILVTGDVSQVAAAKSAGDNVNTTSAAPEPFVSAGLASTTSGQDNSQASFSAGLLVPVIAGSSSNSADITGSVSSSLKAEDDETAPASALEDCDPTHSELYCVYTVGEGDTLSTIADRFGLTSTEDIANYEFLVHSNKPDIVSADDLLQPGQKIRVPYGNGAIHTVLGAQTLGEIADQFGVTVEQIIAVNGMADPNSVSIGVEILIPSPTRFAPIFVADETVPDESDDTGDDDDDGGSSSSGDSGGGGIVGGGSVSASGFIWPTGGPISSYYGPNHPLGIDIDLFNNRGASIGAAMGGVVTFAGGNACCSYGYYVVVDHGNGFTSLYAHLSAIGVSVGEVVAQGQYLGAGGSTGYSTGDHLHFEIHSGGSVVNPLNYLP